MTISIKYLILPTMFSMSFLSGCKAIECGEYRDLIHDTKKREELVRWADTEIFSRKFESNDFRVAGMIGPGRDGANFSLERAEIKIPQWLEGYVIRAVGPDKFQPNVLFVGRRRYQGLIITQNELDKSIKGTSIDITKLEEWSGRVGLICYGD